MDPLLSSLFYGLVTAAFIGGAIGGLLYIASRYLGVEKDPLLAQIDEALPGINCGSCGYAGCSGYAEALSTRESSDITLCKPAGPEIASRLARLLGMEEHGETSERSVAYVRCGGGSGISKREFDYRGLKDCTAASIFFGGEKSCKYGCYGFGSCIAACPVDAISMTKEGVAVVDGRRCIGCEQCRDICPPKVIAMVPESRRHHVRCASQDPSKATRGNCKSGCIGCGICVKKYPGLGFEVENNCASAGTPDGYSAEQLSELIGKCPGKCIVAE